MRLVDCDDVYLTVKLASDQQKLATAKTALNGYVWDYGFEVRKRMLPVLGPEKTVPPLSSLDPRVR
jgi:hypothetical protein